MNKKSVKFKLFIVTSILLISLVTIFMATQSLFFEKFYYTQKTKGLNKKVENFKKIYSENISSNEELYNYAYKFEDENNSQIAILDKNGIIKYIRKSIPYNKNIDSNEVLIMAIKNWVSYEKSYFNVIINKKPVNFIFKNPILNTDNLVVVSPVVVNNELIDIIFVVSTLQPIGEASSVIKTYYIYAYLIVIILIFIMSLFYSKIISNPLIALNKIATKMSNLDFSEKCNLHSNDELGDLANTLNFLSEKLDTTLNQLKDANNKLKKDIEDERKLENMRKDFVAGVSHELKTPISLIEGYAEGLKDGIVDKEDEKYYIDVIIDESKKLNNLVTDMLELSKLESGFIDLNIRPFRIYDLICKVEKKYKNTYKDKIIETLFGIDRNTIVLGDEFKLEGVLNNILNNAIKYSYESSTILIKVSYFNKNNEKNNDHLIIVDIENEGDPIDEKELDLIWEKFYRIDKSRNKYLGGTGLGLSIVKNTLSFHNSNFGIENTNLGVKFYFTLQTDKISN
ncbi:sensor histidine kinase [Hathewaya histolytica]|nr:HAMP domain-containing sensor histidine kinase [Hathewaya histolytica]